MDVATIFNYKKINFLLCSSDADNARDRWTKGWRAESGREMKATTMTSPNEKHKQTRRMKMNALNAHVWEWDNYNAYDSETMSTMWIVDAGVCHRQGKHMITFRRRNNLFYCHVVASSSVLFVWRWLLCASATTDLLRRNFEETDWMSECMRRRCSRFVHNPNEIIFNLSTRRFNEFLHFFSFVFFSSDVNVLFHSLRSASAGHWTVIETDRMAKNAIQEWNCVKFHHFCWSRCSRWVRLIYYFSVSQTEREEFKQAPELSGVLLCEKLNYSVRNVLCVLFQQNGKVKHAQFVPSRLRLRRTLGSLTGILFLFYDRFTQLHRWHYRRGWRWWWWRCSLLLLLIFIVDAAKTNKQVSEARTTSNAAVRYTHASQCVFTDRNFSSGFFVFIFWFIHLVWVRWVYAVRSPNLMCSQSVSISVISSNWMTDWWLSGVTDC